MVYHYYYVNGKRVSMEYYTATESHNAYMKAVVKKAAEYYNNHPFEWVNISANVPDNLLAKVMVMQFEFTEAGRRFKEEWEAKAQKQDKIATALLWLIIIGVPAIVICAILLRQH